MDKTDVLIILLMVVWAIGSFDAYKMNLIPAGEFEREWLVDVVFGIMPTIAIAGILVGVLLFYAPHVIRMGKRNEKRSAKFRTAGGVLAAFGISQFVSLVFLPFLVDSCSCMGSCSPPCGSAIFFFYSVIFGITVGWLAILIHSLCRIDADEVRTKRMR